MSNDPKQKLAELTRAYERLGLKKDTEIYFLEEMIRDFKQLCKNNNIDISVIIEQDNKRRSFSKL